MIAASWPNIRDVISVGGGGSISFAGERKYPDPRFRWTEAFALAREIGVLRTLLLRPERQSPATVTKAAQRIDRSVHVRVTWTSNANRKIVSQAAFAIQQLVFQVGRGTTESIPEAVVTISERGRQIGLLQWRLGGESF